MSIFMTLHATGEAKGLEEFAFANKDKMQAVLQAAERHGLIAHRFCASDEGGKVMVIDEWPDRQSFEAFFQEQESQIRPMMEAAGVTAEPEVTFWKKLDTYDDFGWGA